MFPDVFNFLFNSKKNTSYTNWDTRELLQLPKYSHQLGRDFDLNQWAMPFDNILQPNELPSIAAVKECSAYKLQQQAVSFIFCLSLHIK